MNDDDRYFPCIPTPVGMVPFIGSTMSVECEKELFGKKEEESKVVSREEESLVIHPGFGENQETDTQAVDSRSPQTDQTTQSIQPKPTKPEPPSKEILTDPTQKPDGTKQDTPPVPVDHEAVEKPSEPVADPEE